MIVILDASTLINLVNGGVLRDVLGLDDFDFLVSNMVRDEASSVAAAIDHVVASGMLGLVDDGAISAELFRQAKAQMRLGDGETECILAAEVTGCCIACDDRLARRAAKCRLGSSECITGSIGLLRALCAAEKASPEQAFSAYTLMIERGGYLPVVSIDAFMRCDA